MPNLQWRALFAACVAALCASCASSSCPTEVGKQMQTPVVVAPEPVDAVAGTIALGAACGPALGGCDAEGYCAYPEASACGDGGALGVCTVRPRGCFKDCPGVCGCDGARHCNACVAQTRGISVRHAGACADAPAP